jgi:hypothetical protein
MAQAFQDYSPSQANQIFLMLYECKKRCARTTRDLPLQLNCEAELVQEAMIKLNEKCSCNLIVTHKRANKYVSDKQRNLSIS